MLERYSAMLTDEGGVFVRVSKQYGSAAASSADSQVRIRTRAFLVEPRDSLPDVRLAVDDADSGLSRELKTAMTSCAYAHWCTWNTHTAQDRQLTVSSTEEIRFGQMPASTGSGAAWPAMANGDVPSDEGSLSLMRKLPQRAHCGLPKLRRGWDRRSMR